MSQFPLVLAIEPRLLPYARANGFSMDRKVNTERSTHIYVMFMSLSSIETLSSARCSNVLLVQGTLGRMISLTMSSS